MKKFLTCILIATTLFSCKKQLTEIKPNSPDGDSDPASSSINVKLDIPTQEVITKVSNDTLYLSYTETVSLILDPKVYEKSSAVHFKEDFSKSSLANFSFTTINKDGKLVTNYLEENLNNVVIKSASTITIDGKKFTSLVLGRLLVFSKAYKQPGLAVEAQNNIMKQTNESISFSSYCYINGKNSDTTVTTATIVYKK